MKYFLYTDGSANNFSPYGEGGYAFIITNQDKQILSQFSEGELHATNNTMELKAIIQGCKFIKEKGAEVTVVSDSRYALGVLSGRYKAKANLELIREHYENSQRLKIKYTWIKGHDGDELNEMADQLAQDETFRMREKYGIPVFDYKNSPKTQQKVEEKPYKIKQKIAWDELPPWLKEPEKPSVKTYYLHIETALEGAQCYGAFSVANENGQEIAADASRYYCRTEPRLRLMVLYQALLCVPQKSNVVITPDDSYLRFAISDKAILKPGAFNIDYLNVIADTRKKLAAISFSPKIRPAQKRSATRGLKEVM